VLFDWELLTQIGKGCLRRTIYTVNLKISINASLKRVMMR